MQTIFSKSISFHVRHITFEEISNAIILGKDIISAKRDLWITTPQYVINHRNSGSQYHSNSQAVMHDAQPRHAGDS